MSGGRVPGRPRAWLQSSRPWAGRRLHHPKLTRAPRRPLVLRFCTPCCGSAARMESQRMGRVAS
eukprot:3956699-Alexandrium_andersonii.AAC.1